MMQSASCPQCAAPLPPAAQKCQFCGFVTPWGAKFANQQQQVAKMAADRDRAHRVQRALSRSKNGLILAIVGLPICCGPLSLIGALVAMSGAKQAKAEGQPRPTSAVVAMVIACISMALFVTGTIMFIRDQQKKADRLAEVQGRLQGKRDSVDQKIGCDLVEEYLLTIGHAGRTYTLDQIHCDGALAVTDRRASLPDVRFSADSTHLTVIACLEKRSRWFVIKLLDSGSCADLPPPAPFTPPPRAFSEEEAKADETKTRADLGKTASTTIVKAFAEKLAKIKAHAASTPGGEKLCSKADLSKYVTGDKRKEVPAIDFDFLEWSGGENAGKAWVFLSKYELQKILDSGRNAEDRARELETLRSESGPLLVVYKGQTKRLPVVRGASGSDADYDGGEFDGWLFVYDMDTTDRLCQTRLAFESSDVVNFRKSRFSDKKKKAQEAVLDDFEDRFETAATDAIKRAAPDLRLGYKVLE